jgi:hypothetical protein
MDFILGFTLGVASGLIFYIFTIKNIKQEQKSLIKYSQSRVHELIKNHIPDQEFEIKRPISQAQNHRNSMYTRVVFVENQAYWIKNNTLFVADMDDGMVDEETTREVDTMAMNKVQLEKVIYIVEALTEGKKE